MEILNGQAGLNPEPSGVSLDESAPVLHEVEASTAKEEASLNITCPNCGTEWELTPDEAERTEFSCQECKTTFPIQPDLKHSSAHALKGMNVFAVVIVMSIAGWIAFHIVEGYFPKDAYAYYRRGISRKHNGDLDGAMADDNQAIELDPKYAPGYNSRGNTNAVMRNWAAALADYRQCCELSSTDQDYPRLYIYLIRARLGERDAARKELFAYLGNRKKPASASGDWVATIAGYLLGSVTEADFFAAAGSPNARKSQGQTCEAWYYAGMEKLLDGDQNAAAEYLQKCMATNKKDYVEYGLAQSEAKALGK